MGCNACCRSALRPLPFLRKRSVLWHTYITCGGNLMFAAGDNVLRCCLYSQGWLPADAAWAAGCFKFSLLHASNMAADTVINNNKHFFHLDCVFQLVINVYSNSIRLCADADVRGVVFFFWKKLLQQPAEQAAILLPPASLRPSAFVVSLTYRFCLKLTDS